MSIEWASWVLFVTVFGTLITVGVAVARIIGKSHMD